ncbi:MAG: bacterial transcriptional activator domain-containing protein, partial [Thermomicrobiales bacterium]|nr:bacterial transcriptional activator domain-containing protein [Thermomicrobiales bacterium]
MYRGDFCEEDRFAEWCWLEREQLRETHLDTLERLAALSIQLGKPEHAIHRYRQVLRTDPLRETAEHRLIKCLADAGRRIEALQQYELFCQILQRELSMT